MMNNESLMNLLEVLCHFSTYVVENCACDYRSHSLEYIRFKIQAEELSIFMNFDSFVFLFSMLMK